MEGGSRRGEGGNKSGHICCFAGSLRLSGPGELIRTSRSVGTTTAVSLSRCLAVSLHTLIYAKPSECERTSLTAACARAKGKFGVRRTTIDLFFNLNQLWNSGIYLREREKKIILAAAVYLCKDPPDDFSGRLVFATSPKTAPQHTPKLHFGTPITLYILTTPPATSQHPMNN